MNSLINYSLIMARSYNQWQESERFSPITGEASKLNRGG